MSKCLGRKPAVLLARMKPAVPFGAAIEIGNQRARTCQRERKHDESKQLNPYHRKFLKTCFADIICSTTARD